MSISNSAKGHRDRVREKFRKLGSFEAYHPYEVLEMLLFYVIPRKDTKDIAKNLIATFGSLRGVFQADFDTLTAQPDVGPAVAVFLRSLAETAAFISQQEAITIRGAGDMGEYAVQLMKGKTVEEFYVVALNPKNEIINTKQLASGQFSSVTADIRNVIKFALDTEADKVILIHNHTNGSLVPSGDDIKLTNEFIKTAASVGVTISDHIITSDGKYVSMAAGKFLNREGLR